MAADNTHRCSTGCRLAKVALKLSGLLGCWFCLATVAASDSPAKWHGPGLAHFTEFDSSIPVFVNIIKIDRLQPDLELHTTLGGNTNIGVAIVSEQVKHIPPEVGEAVAAINGDYYFINPPLVGDPMGLQIIRGELISAPQPDRALAYLDASGKPQLTNLVTKFEITWPDGSSTPFGLNENRTADGAVLYTAAAGSVTQCRGGSEFVLVQNDNAPWLPLRIGQTLTAKVREINTQGKTPLGKDRLVLSIGPRLLTKLKPAAPGDVVKISTATVPDIGGATMAIGGGPSLVRDGKAREFSNVQVRHPRTAMGWNDRYFFMVQIDGRQVKRSMGMTMNELAAFMAKVGCTEALNLDGGGSSTMWLNGRVVNQPSQDGERPSCNSLVLVRTAKSKQ